LLKNLLYPFVVNRDYRKPDVESIIAKVAVGNFMKLTYDVSSVVHKLGINPHGGQCAAKTEFAAIDTGPNPANHSLIEHPLDPGPEFLRGDLQSVGHNVVWPFPQRKIVLKLLEYSAIDIIHKALSAV
jgi:hypothetical protein